MRRKSWDHLQLSISSWSRISVPWGSIVFRIDTRMRYNRDRPDKNRKVIVLRDGKTGRARWEYEATRKHAGHICLNISWTNYRGYIYAMMSHWTCFSSLVSTKLRVLSTNIVAIFYTVQSFWNKLISSPTRIREGHYFKSIASGIAKSSP